MFAWADLLGEENKDWNYFVSSKNDKSWHTQKLWEIFLDPNYVLAFHTMWEVKDQEVEKLSLLLK